MNDINLNYIVVEGPIGVGKTSLAKRLSESLNSDLLLEEADKNPFLERFYRNPKQGALSTQLFFLLQRAQQVNDLRQKDMFTPVRVADFLIDKDRLFAQITLDNDELALYDQVYSHLTLNAPKPDLVIYLQASVDSLMERIARRGIPYEQLMESSYLQRLADAYTEFFYHYSDSPLLIVNTSEINFVDSEADYEQLLDQLRKQNSGKHYFNPIASNF